MIAKKINNKIIHVFAKNQFDWQAIRNSGQIFRDPPCEITEEYDKIVIKVTGEMSSDWLWNFFDLDTDYSEIKKELMLFAALREPIKAGQGIRILRQPFVETVISFIISANNNIKRFTKTLNALANEFGTNNSFPTLEQLSNVTESDFKRLGCGYRSAYLVRTVQQMQKFDVDVLSQLDNQKLQKELLTLAGVGPKVCSCIMLFCDKFHRVDVAPVDTWIRKAIEQLGENSADAIMNHKYAGIAQQYIFYYLQYLHKQLS